MSIPKRGILRSLTQTTASEQTHSSENLKNTVSDKGGDKNEIAELTMQNFDWLDLEDFNESGLWIFGYGSLCWHQGFVYDKSLTGYIKGFSRKFWQGNTFHRGTEKRPGRVATLIEDEKGIVWGQAFQVKEKDAFSYLNNRECKLGGYLTTITTFYPRHDNKSGKVPKPFPVILYLATSSNRHWLGESSLSEMANQIVESAGYSGHNVEYLLKLAEFVRENIPEAIDDHLFTLEQLVRTKIQERNLCLETLMGKTNLDKFEGPDSSVRHAHQELEIGAAPNVRQERRDSPMFTSTVSSKKLRCVNIF